MAPQEMIPPNTSGASSGAAPFFSGAPWTKLLVWVWVLMFVLQRHYHSRSSSSSSQHHDHHDEDYHHHNEEEEDEYYYGNYNAKQLPMLLQFLAFDTTGDLVMGLGYLALQLRRLEREIGSVQFAEFCLLQIPMGLILHQILLVLFGTTPTTTATIGDIWNWIPPLPTLLQASSLHWYSYHTPRLYPNFISVGGMKFSEKALMQLWGIYLLMHSHNNVPSPQDDDNEWWVVSSNFATTTLSYLLSGILSSTLYFHVLVTNSSSTDPPLVLLPNWLVNKFPTETIQNWLSGFFLDPPPRIFAPALSGRGVPTNNNNNRRRQQPRQQRPTPTAPPAPVEPSPEAVAQLVAMGFPQDQVTAALRQTNNNVERAADRLLMGS